MEDLRHGVSDLSLPVQLSLIRVRLYRILRRMGQELYPDDELEEDIQKLIFLLEAMDRGLEDEPTLGNRIPPEWDSAEEGVGPAGHQHDD